MGYDPNEPRDNQGQWTSGDAGDAIKSAASDKKVGKINILKSNIIKETDKAILLNLEISDEGGFETVIYPVWIPKSVIDKKELDFRKDMYVANIPEWWLLNKKKELKENFLHNPEIKSKSNYYKYEYIAKNNITFSY